jgi:hypothetical protein
LNAVSTPSSRAPCRWRRAVARQFLLSLDSRSGSCRHRS